MQRSTRRQRTGKRSKSWTCWWLRRRWQVGDVVRRNFTAKGDHYGTDCRIASEVDQHPWTGSSDLGRAQPQPSNRLVAGCVIADTREALTLYEAHYPAVHYIPRKDVDMTLLARTDRTTYCPYKGDASYYSIAAGGERSIDAVWTYETPYAAIAGIKDHLAF